jgi:NADPH2:quinone reductase
MKTIQMEQTGGPDVLRYVDAAEPKPQAGEALIKVEAAGVNFIDVYFREGRYAAKLPLVPGQEAAGTVVEVGEGVATVRAGDRVAWCGVGGTYAEMAVAPASRLVKLPEGVSFAQGAAGMLQGMTAHYLAHSTHPIEPGDEVLVHAGAGGVGLLLTQMAKMLGARVFTTVSTAEKEALSLAAGAEVAIRYTQQDFLSEVKRMTGGHGLAAVYDSVGKTTFEGSLECLRPRGMMALFGASSGPVPPFDLIRLSQLGSLFVTRPTLKDYIATRRELEWRAGDVLRWVAEGKLKLRMEHTYPLREAAQAQRDLEERKTTGKVLLVP